MDAFRAAGFQPKAGAMQEGLQTMWALTAADEGWSLGFGRRRAATLTMIDLVRAPVPDNH